MNPEALDPDELSRQDELAREQASEQAELEAVEIKVDEVELWRRDFFKSSLPELEEDDVNALAKSNVSPYDAEKLRDKGCPQNLIPQILL